MQRIEVSIGGGITCWTLAQWSNQKELKSRLTAIGLGDYAPAERSPTIALKEAMEEICGGPRHLVRPLEDYLGFAVVEEERGKESNTYIPRLSAKIEPATMRISFRPYDHRASKIVDCFNKHLGLLSSANVSSALIKLAKMLLATTIRESGGVYWMPHTSMPKWIEVSEAVSAASVTGLTRIYRTSTPVDAPMVQLVGDSIQNEILADAHRMQQEVCSGELGEKALATREENARALESKVRLYEGILGQSLTNLTDALRSVQVAAAAAKLQISIQGEVAA